MGNKAHQSDGRRAARKPHQSKGGDAPPKNRRPPRSKATAPRTAAQYQTLPEKSKATFERVLKTVSKMRAEKTSLKKAALEIGVRPETVKRWAGSALEKRNGRFSAKKSDQLLRVLKVPSADGTREIAVRGSKRASLLGEYWAALQRYLETGDASRLAEFRGKSVKAADGTEIPLLTDRAELNRMGSAGVLSFESLYSRGA